MDLWSRRKLYFINYDLWTEVAQLVKNPPAVRETWVRSLGWEDLLEKGKATHSSILAWVAKSQIQLSDFRFSYCSRNLIYHNNFAHSLETKGCLRQSANDKPWALELDGSGLGWDFDSATN